MPINQNISLIFTLPGEAIAEVKEEEPGGTAPAGKPGSSTLTVVAVVGSILLAFNLVLLYCYIKRRAAKHIFGKNTVRLN